MSDLVWRFEYMPNIEVIINDVPSGMACSVIADADADAV